MALQVPQPLPKYVNITSKPIGQWVETSHLFYPIAVFLDDSHGVIERVQPRLVYNPRFMHGLDWDSQTAIPAGARYVILHTIPEAYGKSVPMTGAVSSSMVGIPMGGGSTMFLSTSLPDHTNVGPTGTLWVSRTPS